MNADKHGWKTNGCIGVHPRSSAAKIVFMNFFLTV
jgi:hypothetical protein